MSCSAVPADRRVAPPILAIRLPCVSITPFGSLVEPEENWMNARSEGSGRWSFPGREMSVIDSTRKQRESRSAMSSLSPASAASACRRSRFFASVYRYGLAELARDAQELVPVLVADADGERHGHDAAGDRGPERIEELLVVDQKDDELVAALRAERLQVVQDPERAGMDLAVAHAALGALAFDVGDDAVDVAVALEQLYQGLGRHRTSTFIMRWERGRRLICASSSMGRSSARFRRKRRDMRFTWTSISNIAMFSPMQCRGPTEKGM